MDSAPLPGTDLAAVCQALQRARPGHERKALLVRYLSLVAEKLTQAGVAAEHLAPLVTLRDETEQGKVAAPERRCHAEEPSDELLGRVCAVIDLLILGGASEEAAAQRVMRQLVARGVSPPSSGGDARGWKRLLLWRTRFLHGLGGRPAQEEYEALRREIEAIPARERLDRVLSQGLWDRRQHGQDR